VAAVGGVRVPLQISRQCVIASVQVDLTPEVTETLENDVLELIQQSRATGLIIDLSGVELLEPEEFTALRRVMTMARLMGTHPVISGFRPGVVSALMDLDVDVAWIEATRSTDDAIELISASLDLAETATKPKRSFADDLDPDETDDPDPI